jgi:2-polyprenyl-3-methyl-5-hydroxy-6-metoxy-1,4-benzoquinol methylase
MEIYKDKEQAYFTNIRHDLINFVSHDPKNKILEVGAGGGDTLITIKKMGLATEVVGIELNKVEGSNQGDPSIDRFIFGNIESMEIDLPENYFNIIMCGDVLEHLIDPWKTIEKLQPHLKKGGKLIASIPNIRYYRALYQVFVKGQFSYTEFGLFDKTHLRFFCKRDMLNILSTPQLKPDHIAPIFKHLPPSRINTINNFTLGLFEEFLTLQYLVSATKV